MQPGRVLVLGAAPLQLVQEFEQRQRLALWLDLRVQPLLLALQASRPRRPLSPALVLVLLQGSRPHQPQALPPRYCWQCWMEWLHPVPML